jgi:hypothetical protein
MTDSIILTSTGEVNAMNRPAGYEGFDEPTLELETSGHVFMTADQIDAAIVQLKAHADALRQT